MFAEHEKSKKKKKKANKMRHIFMSSQLDVLYFSTLHNTTAVA